MFRRVHAVIVAVGVGSAVRQRTTASGSVNGRGIPTRPMLAMASAAHIPSRSAQAAESMRSQGRIRRAPGKEGTGLSHQGDPQPSVAQQFRHWRPADRLTRRWSPTART